MADLEDIAVISGIGNYSPGGGEITPNAGPYLSIIAGSPEYRTFTAPLSNKGNATSQFSNNSIAVAPNTPIRLVDLTTGNVAYQGTGYEGATAAINAAQALSQNLGNKANWSIEVVPPGASGYERVAYEKKNSGFLNTALDVLAVAAQVGVAVATQGASLGVQMAAAGGTAAATTIMRGGSLEDAIKAGIMAAAPALGARELGPLVQQGLNVSSPLVARSIGAAISTAAAGGLTGQSLEQLATSGAIAGISTYAMPTVSGALKDLGIDLNGTPGSGGGSGGDAIVVTGSTAPGVAPNVTTSGKSTSSKTTTDGGIDVTAQQTAGIGGTTASSGANTTTTDTTKQADTSNNKKDDLTVTATQTAGIGGTTASTGANTTTTDTTKQTDTNNNKKDDEITVTGTKGAGIGGTGPLVVDANLNIDPNIQKLIDAELAKDPENKGLTTADLIRLGLLTPSLIAALLGGKDDNTFVDIGGSGKGVEIVPLNRTQNVTTGGVSGLGAYGFDPFTYGQSIGNQPGEYVFFNKSTLPGFGGIGDLTTGTTGGTKATTTTPTTKATTTTGGTTTTTTGGTRPPGFTGVMSNQKIGDTQVVDGKTYVWGGDDKGWQFLATDNNGKQVLMPTGATNITSIADAFKSGVYRPSNEAEMARLREIDSIMAAADNAKTAAEANKILPGVYFDIDAATARAINRPELVGTQMSQRELQEAKLAADAAARARTAAQIPTQIKAAQSTLAPGTTAQSYYMDYVTPLASSYFSTGQFDAAKARGLQQAVEPFVGKNDLAGAQGAVTSYLSSLGISAPPMAEGGEVDGDDMVSHLIAYHKNGGHQGPGRVKGIGSGQDDKIPAWLSDGEYVWSAQDVADLGDGSTDEGVRRLDKMRQMVRKQAGRKDVKKIAKPQRGIDEMLKAVGGRV